MRVKTELNVSRTAFRVTIQSNLFLHFFINLKQLRRSSGTGVPPGLYQCLRTDDNYVHTFVDTHTHKDAYSQTHCKRKNKNFKYSEMEVKQMHNNRK